MSSPALQAPVKELMKALGTVHDFDQELLDAWDKIEDDLKIFNEVGILFFSQYLLRFTFFDLKRCMFCPPFPSLLLAHAHRQTWILARQAIDAIDNLMSTIAKFVKAALGPVLQFAKTVADKLGSFLCESGLEDSNQKPPRCGLVGFVVGIVKIAFKTLLGFIDGAVDFVINMITKVFIGAVPEIKNLFKPINFDAPFVSSTQSSAS